MSIYKRIFVLLSFVFSVTTAVESVAASFPLNLKGTAPEQASVTVNVTKPAGAIDGFITIRAFDADHPNEGDLVINGKSPIAFWGPSGIDSNNQKWGICHMNIKKQMAKIKGSVMSPPAAAQPTAGGTPPITEPGITAMADTLFK